MISNPNTQSRQAPLPFLTTFIFAVALSGSCWAQSSAARTVVTFSDGASCSSPTGPPTFTALSATVAGKTSFSATGGGGIGRISLDDAIITRTVDNCSVSLFGLFFKTQRVRFVTISFETLVSGAYRQELKITLSDVQISSISDAGTGATIPQERLTLAYGKIAVFDPQTGQTSTYDVLLGR